MPDAPAVLTAGDVAVHQARTPAPETADAGIRAAWKESAEPRELELGTENSGSPCSASDTADTEEIETTAWRDELATRLNLYRARRKPRPPRYPSLRLAFDQPAYRASNPEGGTSAGAFSPISNDALALDTFNLHNSVFVEPQEVSLPAPLPAGNEPSPSTPGTTHNAPHVAKIIEFPRLSSAAPPIPLDELAGPVLDRPRILEAPELIPPPPALGGITIEANPAPAIEKRPGIDIPLQSAPLARRLIAGVADALIIAASCALSGFIFWKVAGVMPPRLEFLALATGVPSFLWAAYQFLLIVYSGGTPGLRLAKLELTCFNGAPANRGLRRWRVLASYLSALSLGMGYAWLFLDEDGLCWHDRISHTYLAPKQSRDSAANRTGPQR